MSESNFSKKNLGCSFNKYFFGLLIILFSSLILRMIYFPFGVPVILDSFNHFWYASDTSQLGNIPYNYEFANNGWPLFITPFFMLLKLNNMISYMELQRITSVSVSVISIIPIYFLCKRFVNDKIALIGCLIFAFEPRLIQDSLSGLNNSMYIALVTTAIVLFLSNKKNTTYYSFAFIGFASIVRSEGLFVFFALSIAYILNNRKNRIAISKYLLLLLVFASIITPMAILRIQASGDDALTSRIIQSSSGIISDHSRNFGLFEYISDGVINFVRFLGWDLIPIFIFFVPVGAILILKNRDFQKNVVIITLIISCIPTFYAYSVHAFDTKYFYYHYPLFCIFSVLAIKKYNEVILKEKILFTIIVIGVIISSVAFIEIKLIDVNHQKEATIVGKYVINNAKGVNNYYPEIAYIYPLELEKKWPILKSTFKSELSVIKMEGYDSLKEFINNNKDSLTHIIVDDNIKTPEFIKDVYYNPDEYPYLKLVFDYKQNNFTSYHVKIYKINYDEYFK